jgi:hypothetical protein
MANFCTCQVSTGVPMCGGASNMPVQLDALAIVQIFAQFGIFRALKFTVLAIIAALLAIPVAVFCLEIVAAIMLPSGSAECAQIIDPAPRRNHQVAE